MTRTILLLLIDVPMWAETRRTIFLITDAEGVGGVCRQDRTDPKDAEMRQLLTGDINAAVEGFFTGGADEVIVEDGHDDSQHPVRLGKLVLELLKRYRSGWFSAPVQQ